MNLISTKSNGIPEDMLKTFNQQLELLHSTNTLEQILEKHKQEGSPEYEDALLPSIQCLKTATQKQANKILENLKDEVQSQILSHLSKYSESGALYSIAPYDNNADILCFEGPQGSGKTSQVAELKKAKFSSYEIAESLPRSLDPAAEIINYENSSRATMPYLPRMELARMSLARRYQHAASQNLPAFLDRSPLTAFQHHLTISRLSGGSTQEIQQDNQYMIQWWENLRLSFRARILVLLNQDLYTSYFRMKKDHDGGNQSVDFVHHILEHTFYQYVVSKELGSLIDITDLDKQQTTTLILNHLSE